MPSAEQYSRTFEGQRRTAHALKFLAEHSRHHPYAHGRRANASVVELLPLAGVRHLQMACSKKAPNLSKARPRTTTCQSVGRPVTDASVAGSGHSGSQRLAKRAAAQWEIVHSRASTRTLLAITLRTTTTAHAFYIMRSSDHTGRVRASSIDERRGRASTAKAHGSLPEN